MFYGHVEVSEQLYYCGMDLVTELHDTVDMNMVSALLYMASCASLLFPRERATKLALSYLSIAEVICEMCETDDIVRTIALNLLWRIYVVCFL